MAQLYLAREVREDVFSRENMSTSFQAISSTVGEMGVAAASSAASALSYVTMGYVGTQTLPQTLPEYQNC